MSRERPQRVEEHRTYRGWQRAQGESESGDRAVQLAKIGEGFAPSLERQRLPGKLRELPPTTESAEFGIAERVERPTSQVDLAPEEHRRVLDVARPVAEELDVLEIVGLPDGLLVEPLEIRLGDRLSFLAQFLERLGEQETRSAEH